MASLREQLRAAAGVALSRETLYGELDAAAGDGDFGAILARAARLVRVAMNDAEGSATDGELLVIAAQAVAGVGGTTGPLWGTGLLRAADAIGSGPAPALRAAAEGIADVGGARAGDRTLLDALLPAAEALEAGRDPVVAAAEGAAATAGMIARRGRASYVPGGGMGHVDAGAQAVADLIAAALSPPAIAAPAVPEESPESAAASPGHIVADPDRLVDDALAGLVAASGGELQVSYAPRFVARTDAAVSGSVALISGGGSGHEPLHAGLIGPGLLTAACPGEVFASPSADAVHAAIASVDTGAGVLLVVKNYTGDVLNFRLGADLARREGHRVETVLVADDIALDDPGEVDQVDEDEGVGRRGVAGTIVVEKICGAAAEAGADLAEVAALGRRVAAATRSIGVAVSGVTLPAGGVAAITLASGEQEFGVGIHGEAGRERGAAQRADHLVARMCEALLADGAPGEEVLLYTNGLGGIPGLELSAVHGYAVRHLLDAGVRVTRSMAASLVTSLGMVGFSLTISSLDPGLAGYWDAPCASAAWTVSQR
ncbi:MAG TPA: dihydroxyacetone kinase subunit DhaK [Frankiaceae bacterium]|jgi:dihydroxyacetone kinase|nr:dihydroxyacetone kinase subunit DhaK [Frankiaceae bacterium]